MIIMKRFENKNIIFEFPDDWNVEKADVSNNPDCVAALSKGETTLLNVIKFPTNTNLEEFKPNMENMFEEDGGIIFDSYLTNMADKNVLYLHGNIDTVDISFDIHSFVFIENKMIYFFEFRTLEVFKEIIKEFNEIVNSFEITI